MEKVEKDEKKAKKVADCLENYVRTLHTECQKLDLTWPWKWLLEKMAAFSCYSKKI